MLNIIIAILVIIGTVVIFKLVTNGSKVSIEEPQQPPVTGGGGAASDPNNPVIKGQDHLEKPS